MEIIDLQAAIHEAQRALAQCPALKEWTVRPGTPEHLASQVAYLCNLYADCVRTLGLVADERDRLKVELEVSNINLKAWRDATNALIDEKACIAKERDAAIAANKAEFDAHKLTIADHRKQLEILKAGSPR